jgi:TM2 domain-containing membrane protein YozV
MQGTPPHKICPNCQTAAHIDAGVCAGCGHHFQTQFTQSQYGAPPNQTQAFYGQPNPNWSPQPYGAPDSNRMLVVILLRFFIGRFGAHRFYLGYTNSAILMLALELIGWATLCFLVGWFFLAAVTIWWIVDLVQILTGNLRPADGTRLV